MSYLGLAQVRGPTRTGPQPSAPGPTRSTPSPARRTPCGTWPPPWGPQADQTAARAEARYAEPDDAYVTRLRAQHETSVQVSGPPGCWDYRYPAHLTGPGAAAYPPPPQPGIPAPEPEAGA